MNDKFYQVPDSKGSFEIEDMATFPIADVADAVLGFRQNMTLLHNQLPSVSSLDKRFYKSANIMLNDVLVQMQKIRTWLDIAFQERPTYASRLAVEKSLLRVTQNAQRTQSMLRKTTFETALHMQVPRSLYTRLETFLHILMISLDELRRHLQSLAREEAVFLTFFQED